MATEILNFGAATTTNQCDGGGPTVYMLGCEFESSVAGSITGNRWLAPTGGVSITCIMKLYRASDQVEVATSNGAGFTATAGVNNDILFDVPFTPVPGVRYVSAVLTNCYAFKSPGGFPYSTAHLTAPATGGGALNGRFRITTAGNPVFPDSGSAVNFMISPIMEFADTATGELDAVLPGLTAELDGEATASGDLDAVLPGLTADLDGEATAAGVLTATLPALLADIVGLVPASGILTGVLPGLTGQFEGVSAAGGATVGPCGWTIPDPLCCAAEWALVDPAIQSAARDYAALILWGVTGRQFGLCEITVRPCGMKRCPDGSGEFWGYDWSGGTWVPYIFNGQWFNCGCGAGCCCDPRCQVRLMGPVSEIVEVLIGGIAVDPATYRVDDEHWLVRTAGECWPQCADMDTDDGDNVFEVTYLRGTAVPNALLRAASTLACEWAKACVGSDTCRLSNRVTSIIRQGITIDMVDPTALLDQGLTGLWEVDTVVKTLNPHGTVERLRIYAPELNVPRMTTWP
jgi:hypothetical protein